MEEGAFTAVLRTLLQEYPNLAVAHVPPQLLITWQHLAEREGDPAADAAMLAWCESTGDKLRSVSYVALHWVDVHCCSLVLDVQTWRRGPASVAVLPAAAAATAATTTASKPAASPARRRKRTTPVRTEPTYSSSPHRVPLLHFDTMPDACGFASHEDDQRAAQPASCMLLRVCRVFNRLYGTAWPESAVPVEALVHLCGPRQQQDVWSCGFHLLRAWELLFATAMPWTPQRVQETCAAMAELPVQQIVQDVRARYQATSSSAVRNICTRVALATVYATLASDYAVLRCCAPERCTARRRAATSDCRGSLCVTTSSRHSAAHLLLSCNAVRHSMGS